MCYDFFFFLSGQHWKKSEAGANRLTNSWEILVRYMYYNIPISSWVHKAALYTHSVIAAWLNQCLIPLWTVTLAHITHFRPTNHFLKICVSNLFNHKCFFIVCEKPVYALEDNQNSVLLSALLGSILQRFICCYYSVFTIDVVIQFLLFIFFCVFH